MSNNMLGDALRIYTGLRHQLDENLLGENGSEWGEQLKRFLRKETCWIDSEVSQVPAPKPQTDNLLELVSTIVISAITGRFVAKDRFVVNTEDNAPVKISVVGGNFDTWFLAGDGKIEDPINEQQVLRYNKLRRVAHDVPLEEGEQAIIPELGGEAKAETSLTEMFSLMEKQKHGEDGVLLNNGRANIFYIRDLAGVLRAVVVYWRVVGWGVGAFGVTRPSRWHVGYQVFSRNSVLKPSETLSPAAA